LIKIWTVQVKFMRLQMEMRIVMRMGLEAIHVTFWPRSCLYFVCALRLCGRLNLKATD
jgi:hypothetical protein